MVMSAEELDAFRKEVLRKNIEDILRDARYVLDHLDEFEEV